MTPDLVQFTHADLLSIAPEIVLAATGCLILLARGVRAAACARWFATLSLAGVAALALLPARAPRSARRSAGASRPRR